MAGSPIFSENFTNRKNSAVLNYHDPYRDPDRHPDQTSRFCGILLVGLESLDVRYYSLSKTWRDRQRLTS